MIGRADALTTEDDATGRKIRAWNDVEEFIDRQRGIVDQRYAGIDHLAEIVRRDVRRHANGDAAGTIYQQVRELGRENRRFLFGAIVIWLEVDGVLVDVPEHLECLSREPRFRISISSWRIAVD